MLEIRGKPRVLKLPDGMKPTLKQLLWANGLKNKDLARIMHTSDSCVSSWVCGARHPNIEQAIAICDLFGVLVEDVDWWPERGEAS